MKKILIFLLLITITSQIQAQRIRDLVNQATPDSTAFLVIDKAGWETYKKIRADVFLQTVSNVNTATYDSLRALIGTTAFVYVPIDTSRFIRSADFSRLSLSQNIMSADYLLDYNLDSVADVLSALKLTGTYAIINQINELGVYLAGSQREYTTGKFIMSGVTDSVATMVFLDSAGDRRNIIRVDPTQVSLRNNQTYAGVGDFDRINLADSGIVIERKSATLKHKLLLNDDGLNYYVNDLLKFKIGADGYFHIRNIYHAFLGFEDLTESIAITQNVYSVMTNATDNLWNQDEVFGFTWSGDTLTIPTKGHYHGMLTLTFTGTNGNEYKVRTYNITETRQEGYRQGGTATGPANLTNVNLPIYIFAESVNTKIVFQITNISGGNAATLVNAQIQLNYLHDLE